MFKPTGHRLYTILSAIGVSVAISVVLVAQFLPRTATAATSSYINFQARLLNSSGSVVPDGNYNIEFKIYDVSSGGSAQWTETRTGGNKVRVANGYLSVSLGSVTAFGGGIDWTQEHWITMNIGGTGSASWDGEMDPRLQLTAVPYALTAGQATQLSTTSGGFTNQLQLTTPSANHTITAPDASGTILLDSTVTAAISGSAFLQGGNSFSGTATLGTKDNNGINFITNNTTTFSLSSTGQALFKNSSNSTTALQVQEVGGATLLSADTTHMKLTIGGDVVAAGTATGTTATTSGTGTNTTTLVLTGAAFANDDVIFIDNAGQDYYTRIVSGGGTNTPTVSPAISYGNASTVTKYNVQNIGATTSDYTSQSNRFYQGYFLGGIVTGAGSTIYADGTIKSTNDLKIDAGTIFLNGDVQFKNGSNSSTAFQLQNSGAVNVFTGDTSGLKVQVGSATTDANAVLLIADSYNNGTDPTGVNGAIYYNTSLNKFRCYQNSGWVDCVTSGGAGANTALSNLSSVAINTSLLPGATTIDLGGTSAPFRDLYLGGNTTNNFKITGTATSSRVLTLPDETGTFCTTAGSASCLAVYNGGGTGVTTVGTINGQTKSANGAVISGTSIYLQTAGVSDVGLVSASSQTFGGVKTFNAGLVVTAGATFNGGLTVATAQPFVNSGSSLYTALSIGDKSSGGDIGTAAATVDVATSFNVNQTTASKVLTLPTPTGGVAGRIVYIANVGSQAFTMYGVVVSPNNTSTYYYNGTVWASAGIDGSGANYIQNQNTSDQTANFRIDGTGRANTELQAPSFDTPSSTTLNIGALNATAIAIAKSTTIASAKNLTVTSGATSLTGLAAGSSTALSVSTGAASNVGLLIQGASSQTADLLRIRDSSNAALLTVDSTGNLTVGGKMTVASVTNSANAFQVQSATGVSQFNLSTISNTQNLLTNGGFESNTLGWASAVSATLTTNTTPQSGTQALNIATSGTTLSGATYQYQFKANTTYKLSFYARVSTSSIATFEYGSKVNGSETACQTSQTLTTTYTQFTCTISVGGTVTSGVDLLYFRKTGTATPIIYLDSVQLELGSTATSFQDIPAFNLINNPDVESNFNGWSAKGSATVTQSEDFAQFGSRSIKTVSIASNADGAKYGLALLPNTRYTLSYYGRSSSGSFNITAGRQDVSGTDVDCSAAAFTTTWTNFTCTFTTGATITTPTSLFFRDAGTTHTYYIDGVSVVQGGVALNYTTSALSLSVEPLYNTVSINNANNGDLRPWQYNATEITAARQDQMSIAVNGYLYEIGGYNGGNQNTVYYGKINSDGSVGSFTTSSNTLPVNLIDAGVATANGYIYLVGGDVSGTVQSTVYYAHVNSDGSTSAWRASPNSLPIAYSGLATVIVNGYIYSIGGLPGASSGVSFAKLNADGTTGAWATTTAMNTGRFALGATVVNGYIYVSGGSDSGDNPQSAVEYGKPNADGTISSWTNTTSLPIGTNWHGTVTSNGYIYVIGGHGTGGATTKAVYYARVNSDATVGSWALSANPLPDTKDSLTATVWNGYLYMPGGYSSSISGPASSIYYTRVGAVTNISGSLDLIGITGGSADTGATGGSLTAGNTSIVGSLQVRDNAYFNAGVGVGGALSVSGGISSGAEITIGKRTDSGGTTSDWTKVSNTTAGTICTQATVDAAKKSVVYNGSLYIGTSESGLAELCRYDNGTTFTRINSAAGTFNGVTSFDSVSAMAVFNGNLYIAVAKSNAASVYRLDSSGTLTLINTTAGRFGTTTNIDSVTAMAVYNGALYIGTSEGTSAELYRYTSGVGTSVFTAINTTAGTFNTTASIVAVNVMVVYNNKLYIGTNKTGAAEVYSYNGGTGAAVFTAINTTAGTFQTATLIDQVTAMTVYNGSLYIGTSEPDGAEVLRYDGGTGASVFTSTNATATIGKLLTTTNIDTIASMTVYNGSLYVGTAEGTVAEVYQYGAAAGVWAKMSQATGAMKASGTTAITSVNFLIGFNDQMYVGTSKSNAAEVYSFSAVEGQSYSLRFGASSDNAGSTESSTFANQGSIYFQAEQSANSVIGGGNGGSFVFSNSIVTNTGAYDVAEDYPTRDDSLQPGDLVSIDPNETGFVKKASGLGDPGIIGVYSANPALRISQKDSTINGGRAIPVALAGRVGVKVSTANGPIAPGDPLMASDEPGVAVKATSASRIVGMAMGSYAEDTPGTVTVFVNPSYYTPSMAEMLENGTTIDGSLSVNGSVKFQSHTDSATAFQVLNAGGDALISVDTATNRVYIGNRAGSTDPTTLVLANKTTAGDPAGANGGMYYNAAMGKFRCYQNGTWTNCLVSNSVSLVSVLTANSSAIGNTETQAIAYTIPAGTSVAGDTYRIRAYVTRTGTDPASPTIRVRVGSSSLAGNIAATLTGVGDPHASTRVYEGFVTIRTVGGSGTAGGGLTESANGATNSVSTTATVPVNTGANQVLELTLSSGNSSNSYVFTYGTIEKLSNQQ